MDSFCLCLESKTGYSVLISNSNYVYSPKCYVLAILRRRACSRDLTYVSSFISSNGCSPYLSIFFPFLVTYPSCPSPGTTKLLLKGDDIKMKAPSPICFLFVARACIASLTDSRYRFNLLNLESAQNERRA